MEKRREKGKEGREEEVRGDKRHKRKDGGRKEEGFSTGGFSSWAGILASTEDALLETE